jgi:hypothetical protein
MLPVDDCCIGWQRVCTARLVRNTDTCCVAKMRVVYCQVNPSGSCRATNRIAGNWNAILACSFVNEPLPPGGNCMVQFFMSFAFLSFWNLFAPDFLPVVDHSDPQSEQYQPMPCIATRQQATRDAAFPVYGWRRDGNGGMLQAALQLGLHQMRSFFFCLLSLSLSLFSQMCHLTKHMT